MTAARPVEALASERAGLTARAKQLLPKADDRRATVLDRLGNTVWRSASEKDKRADYVAAMRWVHEASDNQYRQLRSFRNLVMAGVVGLLILAAALATIGALRPSAVPLCFTPTPEETEAEAAGSSAAKACPTGENRDPSGGDVMVVELLGLVGGALAATMTIHRMRGTNAPYGVPAAMALLKLPFGALTALIVIMLVRADFIPGLSALDTQSQILGYSLVFGYGQQLATRLIDRRGQSVLDKVPATEAPDSGETAGEPD